MQCQTYSFLLVYFISQGIWNSEISSEARKFTQYIRHGSRIVLLHQMAGAIHPEHTEAAALLLIALKHAIDAHGATCGAYIQILAMPSHAIDPIDGARCRAQQIQHARVDAHAHRRLIQQSCNCKRNIRISSSS